MLYESVFLSSQYFFPVVLCWKIIFICPKEHYNNSHWLMMREFLKGDLINSHSFRADGLSNRSTDANNSTVKIHHLEAYSWLLASVPDTSSGTGEGEKRFFLFPTALSCFVETNLLVTAKACTSVQSHHASHNDPRISFTANMKYKFWCSAQEEHLEVRSLQHQLVHEQLPLLQWSHEFSKDQTSFSSLTNRKKNGRRE